MELRERLLYHQIHPLKLGTDVGTAAAAAALLWRHQLVPALIRYYAAPKGTAP